MKFLLLTLATLVSAQAFAATSCPSLCRNGRLTDRNIVLLRKGLANHLELRSRYLFSSQSIPGCAAREQTMNTPIMKCLMDMNSMESAAGAQRINSFMRELAKTDRCLPEIKSSHTLQIASSDRGLQPRYDAYTGEAVPMDLGTMFGNLVRIQSETYCRK